MAKIVTMMIAMRNAAFGDHEVLSEEDFEKIRLAYGKSHKSKIFNQLLEVDADWVQLAQSDAFSPLFAIEGVSMKVEKYQPDVLGTLNEKHYVNLDFLGFGMRRFEPLTGSGLSYVFPTLSKRRYRAAMCFAKSEKGYNLSKDTDRRDFHIANLSKYQSIWLMGGWMDKEVNAILAACYFKTLT